jgi:hypothetical protein
MVVAENEEGVGGPGGSIVVRAHVALAANYAFAGIMPRGCPPGFSATT